MKVFWILFIFIIGCAKPRYETPSDVEPVRASSCFLNFKQQHICGGLYLEVPPKRHSETRVIVYLAQPLPNDWNVQLVAVVMPAHGHGTAPTTTTKIDSSHFRVTELYLTMTGEWDLTFSIVDTKGQVVDQTTVPIYYN